MANTEEQKWLVKKDAQRVMARAVEELLEAERRPMARNCSARNAAAIQIGLLSGLRVTEMCSLTWGDIWERRSPPQLSVRRGKRGKSRDVFIPERLIEFLARYKRWCAAAHLPTGPDDPILHSWRSPSKPMTRRAVELSIERVGEAAGLNQQLTPHHLRHTYASHLWVSSKRDFELVKRQLGHDMASTTMIYIGTLKAAIAASLRGIYT